MSNKLCETHSKNQEQVTSIKNKRMLSFTFTQPSAALPEPGAGARLETMGTLPAAHALDGVAVEVEDDRLHYFA